MSKVTALLKSFVATLCWVVLLGTPGRSVARGINEIRRIHVKKVGGTTEIYLHGSRPATFSAYRQSTPPGVVLELSQSRMRGYTKPIHVGSWAVSQVATVSSTSPGTVKILVSLAKRSSYQVLSLGRTVKLSVTAFEPFPHASHKASLRLATLKKEAEATQARLVKARKMAQELERKSKKAARFLRVGKQERRALEETLNRSRAAVAQLLKERTTMAKAVAEARKEVARIKRAEEKAREQYRFVEKRTLLLNRMRQAKEEELKSLSRKITMASRKGAQLKGEMKSLRKKIDQLQRAIVWKKRLGRQVSRDVKKRLQRLQEKMSSSQRALVRTQKEVGSYRKAHSRVDRQKRQEEKKLKLLRVRIARERDTLVARISRLKSTTTALSKKKRALLQELRGLSKKRREVNRLFEKQQALASKMAAQRVKAEVMRRQISTLTREETRRAKAARLKRRELEALLQRERRNLKALSSSKRMEQRALSRLRSLRKRHHLLLQQERRRLTELKKRGDKREAQRLQKQQAARASAIAAQARAARVWEKRVRVSRSAHTALGIKLKRTKGALLRMRSAYASVQLELAKLARDKDLARAQLFKTTANLESVRLKTREERRRLGKIRRATSRKLRRLSRVSRKLNRYESRLSTLSRSHALKESELKSLSDKSSRLKARVSKQRKEIRDNRAALAALERQRSTLKRQLERAARRARRASRRELQTLNAHKAKLTLEIKRLNARHRALSAKVIASSGVASDAVIHGVQFVDSPWSHQVVLRYKGGTIVPKTLHKGTVLLVTMPSVRLRHDLRRRLNTEAYKGPIKSFLTWNQLEKGQGSAILKVNTRGIRKAEVRRSEGRLVVLVPKTISEVRSYSRRTKTVHPTKVAGYLSAARAVAAKLPAAPRAKKYRPYRYKSRRRRRRSKRRYYGRFVDLDFKDADIHNVLRLVAEVWGRNVVIPDDVKGTVTIKLTNVRVDRAFDVIVKSKGLAWNYEGGNIIRVITGEQQKKEREEYLARTKTKVQLIKVQTRLIPINYASASDIAKAIKSNVKSKRGKVTFDKRTNVIIYVDIPSKLAVAQKLVRSLDLPTPQVQIEARIVEAESTFLREIGVQWGGSMLASSATGNPTGLIFPSNIGMAGGNMDNITNSRGIASAGAANPDFAVNLPASTGQGSGGALGMTLGSLAGAVNINLRLSAMEEVGHVRSIAAPKITTLDNVEASISQGVEIPYPQSSAQGNTVIMKQAVLSLSVTPHVTNDNNVKLKIKVTKDEPDETNRGSDGSLGIAKKSASTELLVKSGDTAVIGGIYKRQSTLTYSKVPWFADIPIIGWLFKSQYKKDTRSELLIFITPRVLNRSALVSKR